jgi:hypothetical protein
MDYELHYNQLSNLENLFPYIVQKIELLWGNRECETYLKSLFIDARGGRSGFPPDILSELNVLLDTHVHLYQFSAKNII